MVVRSLIAGSVLCFAATAVCGYVILSDLRLAPDSTRSVARTAELLVTTDRLPGISYAVIDGAVVAESGAVGVADTSSGEPLTSDTLFEAASLTKPLVAYMAMLEVERGTLDLDRPAAAYIGTPARIAEPKSWARVTIRHLLSHRSGLPNWSGNPNDRDRDNPLTFLFDPGVDFDYSGEGYGLLLKAVAAAAGETPEALASKTLSELGMSRSSMTAIDLPGPFARGHWRLAPDRPVRRTQYPVAAYSLVTTASDYAKLLIAWIEPPVREETRDSFVNAQSGDHYGLPDGLSWSLGWGVQSVGSTTTLFQWGDNGAFRTFAGIDMASERAIVYLTNGSLGTLQANALATPVIGDVSPAGDWFATPQLELARLWARY